MNTRQTYIFKHFETLISTFEGIIPFHLFFNKYCKIHPSLGSKDRRILREIIYSAYRLGNSWRQYPLEKLFLVANKPAADDLLKTFYQDLDEFEKLENFEYPFIKYLDENLRQDTYYQSLQKQPLVWVRIANKNKSKFIETYKTQIVTQIEINDTFEAIGLNNTTPITASLLPIEVQDIASQQVSHLIDIKEGMKVWDCCCGAGGKALFVTERYKNFKLFASDVRANILDNLKTRFKQNRLMMPKLAECDLLKKPEKINFGGEHIGRNTFDIIIADVPCSGSGTWAREPENLTFFKAEKIEDMVAKQIKIVTNSLRFLKHEGTLYYITCSVFDSENFGVIHELESLGLVKIIQSQMVYGYDKLGDNLFIAELKKVKY
jgi:16S rRNA (cytosine967-C5)-methyltransferase